MAENYHLKWDSHLSYLNSSVATLYKNEKFADVVLYSSYSNSHGNADIPTVGISAHKFILSSCSQFFATMFETAPIMAPNGVFYVVLPPDLSYRAIQILVQYMYSGEATVSNDILNEVLRGGEILKIRGLCRTSSSLSSSHHGHHQHHHHQRETGSSSQYIANGTRSTVLPSMSAVTHTQQLPNDIYVNSNKCPPSSSSSSSRYALEHSSAQPSQQFRGLGASVMIKDSPVIVKSPKLTHPGLLSIATTSSKHHTGISINKEVAIDPEDKCCYQETGPQLETLHAHQPPQQQPPPVQQPISICTEVGCRSCPMAADVDTEPILRRRNRSSRGDERPMEREYVEPRPPDEHSLDEVATGIIFDRRLRRESAGERVRDYFVPEHFDHAQMNTKPFVEASMAAAAVQLPTPPHPHNFLAIKQEPSDWSNSAPTTNENSADGGLMQHRPPTPSLHSPKQPLDFKMPLGSAAVKLEANSNSGSTDDEDSKHYNNFKLLLCDICQKSFEDTKSLVRHLETHNVDNLERNQAASGSNICTLVTSNGSSSGGGGGVGGTAGGGGSGLGNDLSLPKSYVPKKRRRISQQENNMDHVTLLCDLCSTSFETPAEWVRHMSNQHTEIELAMFNSKKDGEQKNNVSSSVTTNIGSISCNNTTTTTTTTNTVSDNSSSNININSNNQTVASSSASNLQNQTDQQSTRSTHKKYNNSSSSSSNKSHRATDVAAAGAATNQSNSPGSNTSE